MNVKQESYSALVVSVMRAIHSRYDPDPLISDPYGLDLLDSDELVDMARRLAARFDKMGIRKVDGGRLAGEPLASVLQAHPGYGNVILRTRYTEELLDKAVERGCSQLVVLGAGLDTFGLRRPELASLLRVFEVDHAASQAMKQRRLAAVNLAPPANVIYLPVDFEQETLGEALLSSEFNQEVPAFFSWLGVSPYLTTEAHFSTIRSVAMSTAAECELVFNYIEKAREGLPGAAARKAEPEPQAPEPIISRFEPADILAMLVECGFEVIEDIGPSEIVKRYCAGRPDRLMLAKNFRLVHARKSPIPA